MIVKKIKTEEYPLRELKEIVGRNLGFPRDEKDAILAGVTKLVLEKMIATILGNVSKAEGEKFISLVTKNNGQEIINFLIQYYGNKKRFLHALEDETKTVFSDLKKMVQKE